MIERPRSAAPADLHAMVETYLETSFGTDNVLVTEAIRRMLADAVGIARAREILLFGEPLSPARALEVGLVRELAPAEQVGDRAIACARFLAAKPPIAYREIKKSLRDFGGREDTPPDRSALPHFLDMWFSEEAQAARRAVA